MINNNFMFYSHFLLCCCISAKNLQPSDASEEIKDVVSGGEGGGGEVGSTTHTIHNSKEYCEREYFDAKCPEGEAILVRSAVYGRMRPGMRCLFSCNYGTYVVCVTECC